MNFDYTPEEKARIDNFNMDINEWLVPIAAKPSSTDFAPIRDNLAKLGKKTGLGWSFSAASGGQGLPCVEVIAYLQKIGAVCPSTFLSLDTSVNLCGALINQFGSDKQKETYLAGLLNGSLIGAFVAHEQAYGDIPLLPAAAVSRSAEGWTLNGQAPGIVNAPMADFFIVLASTNGGESLYVVDRNRKGLKLGPALPKDGLPAGPVAFEDCRIDQLSRLGEDGQGGRMIQTLWCDWLLTFAAGWQGILQATLESAYQIAMSRESGGKKLMKLQEVSFKLADMKTLYDACGLLLRLAAWKRDRNDPEGAILARCAKLMITESVSRSADLALSIAGAADYFNEGRIQRIVRVARLGELMRGSSELLRRSIAMTDVKRYQ